MQYKIGIIGITGKVGHLLSKQINKDMFPLVLTANSRGWEQKQVPDIIINISAAEAVEQVVDYCAANNTTLIEGTSGMSHHHLSLLKELALQVPVLQAENFSILHYLQCQLLQQLIAHIPENSVFQFSVNERHTISKKDAPSATAYKLAGLFKSKGFENVNINYTRCGLPVSDHECRLTLDNEELIISHKVQNRAAAIGGIMKAIQWIRTKKPGFFTMEDVYVSKQTFLV